MRTRRRAARACATCFVLAALHIAGCSPFARQNREPAQEAEPPRPATAEPVPVERPAPEPKPSVLVHTVRWRGESLSIIAKWYTGKAENWRILVEHNPLNDPDRIGIGDRIAVPEPLLKTREPLPRGFVRRHAPAPAAVEAPEEPAPDAETSRSSPREVPEPAPEEETPELFGPKGLKSE